MQQEVIIGILLQSEPALTAEASDFQGCFGASRGSPAEISCRDHHAAALAEQGGPEEGPHLQSTRVEKSPCTFGFLHPETLGLCLHVPLQTLQQLFHLPGQQGRSASEEELLKHTMQYQPA